MKRQVTMTSLALAVASCSALWTVQAGAQTSGTTIDQLQQQINSLQQQVQDMKKQQMASQAAQTGGPSTGSEQAQKGPTKKLNIGGGIATEYQVKHTDQHGSNGSLILDYFDLNFKGQYGNLTYASDYRWSDVNFADGQYLHTAWADYAFGPGKSSHIKGGMFQVPFGNLPYGYQSFWGNLGFYTGFTDNQAAGLGYRYEANGWRFDLDAFKNDNLGQSSTYGANPFQGYQRINEGVGRLGYTFDLQGDNSVNVSVAGRGGQLKTGNSSYNGVGNGTHWAGTVAADANLGLWVLQGQFVDYKYNIPSNRQYNGAALPTDSITLEDYGYGYRIPAEGQQYTASVGRNFPVDLGPISNFEVYDDYGYLHSGVGNFTKDGYRIGDVQDNVLGVLMTAGPVYIWADVISSKNGAMVFNGPNDGTWHHRFNLTAAFYFDGDIIK
jgi:hypothetical protein